MGHIEKTVFISYRHTNYWTALAVYQDLTTHGFDAFIDYQNLRSGEFDKVILVNIKARAHFLVLLAPSALDRCNEPDDWMRREIETALVEKRNIVPLMVEGFDFDSPAVVKTLTGRLSSLKKHQGLPIYPAYFSEAMERLRKDYLNVEVPEIVLHPLSNQAKELTKKRTVTADNEAIRLRPNYAKAYFSRGHLHRDKGDWDNEINNYDKAILLNPNLAIAHYDRGRAFLSKGDNLLALSEIQTANTLEPTNGIYRSGLILVLRNLGQFEEAKKQEQIARELIKNEADYNRACFEAICGNAESAFEFLKIASAKREINKEWARRDPDLENIRDDLRFKELVGE